MQMSVKFWHFAETGIPLPISDISPSILKSSLILRLYLSYIPAVLIEIYQLDMWKVSWKKWNGPLWPSWKLALTAANNKLTVSL